MSTGDGEQRKRAVCGRCARPPRACYCSALPTRVLRTDVTHVLVLQHEREQRRRQAISSVPVLCLVLERDVDVVRVAEDCECGVGADARLDELLYAEGDASIPGFDAALILFPDAQAKLLDGELLHELGLVHGRKQQPASATNALEEGHEATRRRVLLVVIDGTWTEAKKIAFHNCGHWEKAAESWRRRGKRFEYVCLGADDADATADGEAALPGRSIYGDLRREPMDGCVSTLEAVGGALRVLETPATGESMSNALLSAFRGMVAVQSAFQQRGKADTLRRHGGVSKEAAIQAKTLNDTSASGVVTDVSTPAQADASLLRREYVFYSTRMDFRQRQELVQQGGPTTCTYDQARDKCGELNVGRKRGQRLAFLPRHVFQQRQRDQSGHASVD